MMQHQAFVLCALLLCARISFCMGSGELHVNRERDSIPAKANTPLRWGEWPQYTPRRPKPPSTPPPMPTPTAACPVMPIRMEQPPADVILNLTGIGLKQIGQAYVRSENIRELYLDHNAILEISPMAFDELPRLEVLSLAFSNLSVSKMLWFNKHSALRSLTIDDNIPKEKADGIYEFLQPLPRLKKLFLRRNTIFDFSIDLNQFAPQLNLLDMSGNKISSTSFLKNIPNTIAELLLDDNRIESIEEDTLSNVETLSVSGNRIAQLCGANTCSGSSLKLAGMTRLKKLDVSRNSIANVAEDAFQDATSLTVLDLSNNQVMQLSSNVFKGLQKMHELRLNGNRLSVVPHLCSVARLMYLDLAHNRIVEVAGDGLCELPLETVNISSNHIMNVHEESLLNLRGLRKLDLSNNVINHLPLTLISHMQSLVDISLRNNSIENIDELFGQRFTTQKKLHLEDNPLRSLRAACTPYLIVNLKRITMDYGELYNDVEEWS